jgi:predicted Zn-dependent protease
MLALAAEREQQFDLARGLLTDLNGEFPDNPVFAHELSLLNAR